MDKSRTAYGFIFFFFLESVASDSRVPAARAPRAREHTYHFEYELTLADAVPKHGLYNTRQINTRHTTHAHTYPCRRRRRPLNIPWQLAACITGDTALRPTGSVGSGSRLCAAALRRRRSAHSPPSSKRGRCTGRSSCAKGRQPQCTRLLDQPLHMQRNAWLSCLRRE